MLLAWHGWVTGKIQLKRQEMDSFLIKAAKLVDPKLTVVQSSDDMTRAI